MKTKILLLRAWHAGVESVGGARVTRDALAEERIEPITRLLAVGKAAASMCAGALDYFAADGAALVVTPYGHGKDAILAHPRITVIEAGHPLPDENSLRAGRAMVEFVRAVAPHEALVMLVSGGASALAEVLPDAVGLAALRKLTEQWLADGSDIAKINAARCRLSRIKGGRLLSRFGGKSARVYAISDVPGERIDLIGSGIGDMLSPAWRAPAPAPRDLPKPPGDAQSPNRAGGGFDYRARVIASNRIARQGAAAFLRAQGTAVIINQESLHQDIHAAAQQLAADLINGPPGAYIWGGEPSVILPPAPGVGGRNQSLALSLAKEIRGQRRISALVAGTDGVDSATRAAGGLVDGDTFDAAAGANNALLKADAGTYLARLKALFKPGPTGTNVMDLAIAIKLAR